MQWRLARHGRRVKFGFPRVERGAGPGVSWIGSGLGQGPARSLGGDDGRRAAGPLRARGDRGPRLPPRRGPRLPGGGRPAPPGRPSRCPPAADRLHRGASHRPPHRPRARPARRPHEPGREAVATPMLRDGVPVGIIEVRRGKARPSRASESALSRRSPSRRPSPSRSWTPGPASWSSRWSSRRRRPRRSCGSSLARRPTSSPSSTRSPPTHSSSAAPCGAPSCDSTAIYCISRRPQLERPRRGRGGSARLPPAAEPGRRDRPRDPDPGRRLHPGRARGSRVRAPDARGGANYLSVLAVPMLREGNPIGVVTVTGAEAGAFSQRQIELLETFADQAVIAIENVRLFKELETRNRDLTETLEQQTATGEILRVISSSPTDVQPVFDTIAQSAARLCEAELCFVYRFEGGLLHFVATMGSRPRGLPPCAASGPRHRVEGRAVGRAVLDRRSCTHPGRPRGSRATRSAPWQRSAPFAAWSPSRWSVTGFPSGQSPCCDPGPGSSPTGRSTLLKTFADQAVIAIENVRLFKELEERNRDLTEALEQQTATGEILRVISSSPTDVQPVLDTVAESAARLCEAFDAAIWRRSTATAPPRRRITARSAIGAIGEFSVPLVRGTVTGRSVLDRRTIHVADMQAEVDEFPRAARTRGAWAIRTILSVAADARGCRDRRDRPPPNRGAALHGAADRPARDLRRPGGDRDRERPAIPGTGGAQPRPDRDAGAADSHERDPAGHLELADRRPAGARHRRGERRSAVRGVRRCHRRRDGERVLLVAHHGGSAGGPIGDSPAHPRDGRWPSGAGRADHPRRRTRKARSGEFPESSENARRMGFRTILSVAVDARRVPIGSITVRRTEAQLFTERQVALLETFADQAVIAIENVRLFTELEARNRDLTETLEQQTATAEILRVISSSPTDVQPVFDAIVQSATRLCDAAFGAAFRFDGELQTLTAHHNVTPDGCRSCIGGIPHGRRAAPRPGVRSSTAASSTSPTSDRIPNTPARHCRRSAFARCWPSRCCAKANRSGDRVVRRDVALHRQADRARGDLRRPGSDRHRERPSVPGAGGAQ